MAFPRTIRRFAWRLPLLALPLSLAACSRDATAEGDVALGFYGESWDPSPHRSHFVRVNGVRLNVLDWGGAGPPIVLVHDVADNPHVFDELAGPLRRHFRVIAYALRGHGDSEAPAHGAYDVGTRVEDLRELLDTLGVARAHLLGWSMGGDDITAFAGRYPERTGKLVYLDADYDFTDQQLLLALEAIATMNAPDTTALSTFDEYARWVRDHRIGGVELTPAITAYLRHSVMLEPDGRVRLRDTDSALAARRVAMGGSRRDYTAVRAPVLALSPTRYVPDVADDPERSGQMWYVEQLSIVPHRDSSIERLRAALPHADVRRYEGATHLSIGVRNPEKLAAAIAEFLLAP